MIKKLYRFIFPLAMIITLILSSGCAAVNYPQAISAIDPGATIRGMQQAVNGVAGTYILQQGENLVMGWPDGAKYAWVAFSPNGQLTDALKTLCGNKACPEAAGDLYNYLVNNGWQSVSTGAVPAVVASTIRQLGYLISIGASLPILPVLMMPIVDPMELINPKIGA